ncbi:hypothetical protein FNV43_RR02005 [Rhamnella rubrinervis]|uniref:Fibronectin type III-like domain-containing protein n=1 Tax=Rhamnella rubrinervis TaxID=2594499 RepID=A0A8K0HT78_9ROSA|nr:hypothetical protein FNV43_RR02005 [Rhamnella rubrinervis]
MAYNNNSFKRFRVLSVLALLYLSFYTKTGEARRPFACDPNNKLTKSFKFCGTSVPISERVTDLIGRLTLQEKFCCIESYEWWSEALHGVSNVGPGTKFGGDFPGATSFPQVITTAASFNDSLWELIGQVVSDEARAMYNGGAAGLTYWSPNVNILRDPRWGRGQETPVKIPSWPVSMLLAMSGDSKVMQQETSSRLQHVANITLPTILITGMVLIASTSMPSFGECTFMTLVSIKVQSLLYNFRICVSKQDLEETYNVPFKGCVLEGKVASVMCSYNQVNGKPTCADPDILKNTIRGEWGLNGYIVSDCDSVSVLYDNQHYTRTPEEAAADSINAGLDLDCGQFLAVHTEEAVKRGLVTESNVNNALANTIAVQMRLGMFDGEPSTQPFGNLGYKDVCTPAHQQLALEAAHQGIVLLKNHGGILPLSNTRHKTVAVIGPNADVNVTMIGNYAGIACGYTTPLQGIGRYSRTIHQQGCADVACNDNEQFEAAEAASKQADATVLIMGLDQSIEAESRDRTGLLLPGYQQELVFRVARASRGPTVLVLMSGGPVDVSFAKKDPRIGAILWVGYPGQAGGAAIADVLFGTTNPGGKLPMTWYPESYLAKAPMTNMNMRADPARGYPGRTYRFYRGPVVFPFGHGLTFTTFDVKLVEAPARVSLPVSSAVNSTVLSSANALKLDHTNCNSVSLGLHITVKNNGTMDGAHTVLVYSTPPAGKWSAAKKLVGFKKVHVPAGTDQRIMVGLQVCQHLSVVDQFGVRRIPLGQHQLQIGEDLNHSVSFHADLRGPIKSL